MAFPARVAASVAANSRGCNAQYS